MCPVYDEEGKIIEGGMTKEEVEATVKKATEDAQSGSDEKIDEIKKEHDEKIAEFDEKIKEKDELLLKADDKNINFKKLREEKEALEKSKKELEEKQAGIETSILGKITAEKVDEEIEKRTGGDEEKTKLVKFHYDNFKGEPKDAKERKIRLDNACHLAGVTVPGEKTGIPVGATGFRGGAFIPKPKTPGGGKVSEETKKMGKEMMGLNDKDFERVEKKP